MSRASTFAVVCVLSSLVMLSALLSGCSGDGKSSAPTATSEQQLAAAQRTPLFRNLGKRGESDL